MKKDLLNQILHSPFGLQLASLSFLILFLTSFKPLYYHSGQTFHHHSSVYFSSDLDFPIIEPGFLENSIGVNTAGTREVVVEDENGNLVKKLLPKKRTTAISYIVKSGDNSSKISHKFGLKVSTLNWANDLTSHSTLNIGQKLIIPPTDGVYYKVQAGETLGEIAKIHEIDLGKIRLYNGKIKKDVIKTGQMVFLPAAQRLYVERKPVIELVKNTQQRSRNIKTTSSGSSSYKPYTGGTLGGSMGIRLRRPTKGVLTQGFNRSHYAIDIASKMNTPIYASADGVVKISSAGKWNWGYGSYIVVDHGNEIETLYAHNNVLKVGVGDKVRKGQLIALMGNSGNVRGITGIHLHFELRIRGRKVNPANYFK